MAIIPIRMEPVEVHIHADRRLAFQVLTAFGARQPDGGSSRVLREEAGRMLVEFHTVTRSVTGRRQVYRSVDWVTRHEPERIDFEAVESPLALARDRFLLEDVGGCTRFRYESTFGLRGGTFGWLVGMLLVRPFLRRFMREHAGQLTAMVEARAKQSRRFPYRECGTQAASVRT